MKRRRKVHEFGLRVGDAVVWPDGAIVLVEAVGDSLFRTRCLATGKLDWLQHCDWLDGDYTVVRAKK